MTIATVPTSVLPNDPRPVLHRDGRIAPPGLHLTFEGWGPRL